MRVQVQVKGVKRELSRINAEASELTRIQFSRKVSKLFYDVKGSTPFKTGRARNSWNLSNRQSSYIDAGKGQYPEPLHVPLGDFIQNDHTLYLSNGVPYIRHLNDGSSKQAPKRFIEQAILRNV